MEPNGSVTFDTLEDAARAYAELRGESAFIREQLAHINTTLDLILKALEVDEKKHEAEHA